MWRWEKQLSVLTHVKKGSHILVWWWGKRLVNVNELWDKQQQTVITELSWESISTEQIFLFLHPHQLFTGVQFEEARDELREGLYRPPTFHSPFLLLHDGSVAHSLQQQINYENAEITKLIQSKKTRETVEEYRHKYNKQCKNNSTVFCDSAYILIPLYNFLVQYTYISLQKTVMECLSFKDLVITLI